MGLDIYFNRREKNNPRENEIREARRRMDELDLLPDTEENFKEWQELDEFVEENLHDEEVGYFRKVNFLMRFFNYVDNCKDVILEKSRIEDLVNITQNIIDLSEKRKDLDSVGNFAEYCENKFSWEIYAQTMLPTTSGFFFGSTAYNEWYLEDVKSVNAVFKGILKDTNFDYYDIVMCASY